MGKEREGEKILSGRPLPSHNFAKLDNSRHHQIEPQKNSGQGEAQHVLACVQYEHACMEPPANPEQRQHQIEEPKEKRKKWTFALPAHDSLPSPSRLIIGSTPIN